MSAKTPVLTTQSISVVIAAYNEADNLEYVLHHTLQVLDEITCNFEVIIIDDGSQDTTGQIADVMAVKYDRVRVIHHGQNRGLGAALITGYANVSCDWVTPLPADGQIPPKELKKYISHMPEADIIIGLRPRRPYNSYRKLLHNGLAVLTKLLFGRDHPPGAGSCMFKCEVFRNVRLLSTSGFANLEFPIKAVNRGYRLATVPIETTPRLSGHSKVTNLPTMLITILDMFKSYWSLQQ